MILCSFPDTTNLIHLMVKSYVPAREREGREREKERKGGGGGGEREREKGGGGEVEQRGEYMII